MPRTGLRALALVAFLGQLQLLPAAIACARQHQRPAAGHCQTSLPTGGPSVQAGHDGAPAPLCALLGTCSAPAPAAVAPTGAGVPAGPVFALASSAFTRPLSFSTPPVTPPPQA